MGMLRILMATKDNVQNTFPDGLTPDDEAFLRQFLLYANSDRDNSSEQQQLQAAAPRPLDRLLKSAEAEAEEEEYSHQSNLQGVRRRSSCLELETGESALTPAAALKSLLDVLPGDVYSSDDDESCPPSP